jgi:molybdopterin-guanine dinucleotide biosynthesis protein A
VPRWQGESEPLHAVYSRRCITVIEPVLRRGGGRIVELYAAIRVRYLEPEEIACFDPEALSFFNINSPEDWERAQVLAAREG